MDLEVLGRHAMLFDDDGMAAFVNSEEALVEWNSLSIDRYDVRHLLSAPLPPRLKRRPPLPETDLDHERYLDLPSSSQPQDDDSDPVNSSGYHAVTFSYENSNVSTEVVKDNDAKSGFRPNFPVPESLLHNLVAHFTGTLFPFDVMRRAVQVVLCFLRTRRFIRLCQGLPCLSANMEASQKSF
ncbi:hypothetical protein RJT34_10864 [Clitoria ternatea]|uniref:Suppressor of white apricot N-terminal domain-containing protein n=1 Tax=Clitoria ternatea TaxID=43366 RepID=A0AAN9PJ10_CLITE